MEVVSKRRQKRKNIKKRGNAKTMQRGEKIKLQKVIVRFKKKKKKKKKGERSRVWLNSVVNVVITSKQRRKKIFFLNASLMLP